MKIRFGFCKCCGKKHFIKEVKVPVEWKETVKENGEVVSMTSKIVVPYKARYQYCYKTGAFYATPEMAEENRKALEKAEEKVKRRRS